MKRRTNDAKNPPGPNGRTERRSGPKLAESQPGQRERERERERRVSDADASYKGPARGTRLLSHAIPQTNHAITTLSRKRPGPSPKGPAEQVQCRPQGPTQTRPYVNPDTTRVPGTWLFIPHPAPSVKSPMGRMHLSVSNIRPLYSPVVPATAAGVARPTLDRARRSRRPRSARCARADAAKAAAPTRSTRPGAP